MKATATTFAALSLCAGAAIASPVLSAQVDRSGYEIYDAHAHIARGESFITSYSDMEPGDDGFAAFDDTAIDANDQLEVAGIADYASVSASDIVLNQFRFVGGVDQDGGIVFFDFFDSTGSFVDGFGVRIAEAGSFRWTIDLNEAITIANSGFVRMAIDDEDLAGAGSTAAGRWFLGNNGATIGSAGDPEDGADFNHLFELNTAVPSPGSLALLGMGGVVASRRRRA